MAELPIDLAALIKLTQRSQDLLYDENETNAYAGPHQQLRVQAAELAIVAAARTVAHVGAIGLVPDVRRWAELSPTGEDPISIPHALIDALAICVRDGLDVEQLEPMLDGFEDWMIAKIAEALDPERERSLALLQRLADDPRAQVSAAASKRLGARRQWCWWAGIFEHDPIEAHADDPALVEALRRARAALGRESAAAQPARAPELCDAVVGLPSTLAIPLLEAGVQVFPYASYFLVDGDERLAVELHARGGIDALARALQRVPPSHGDAEAAIERLAPWFGGLPSSDRVELDVHLLDWLDDGEELTRRGVARFIRSTWPRDASPVPLVEWLAKHRSSVVVATFLRVAVKACTAELEPHADRLLELAQASPILLHELRDFFAALGRTVSKPTLIRLVEAAAAASDDRLRTWALEQRTARLAPADAAERDALAHAWLDDPQMRELIGKSDLCGARLLPWLRRRLRAGALTLSEANHTISAIGRLYGGVITSSSLLRSFRPSELEAAEQRKQSRAQLGVWVDAPTGPVTAEEWASLRALARQELATGERAVGILSVRPIGPWRPEDLELLDALERKVVPIGTPGIFALLHYEQLLEVAGPPDASARAKRVVERWQDDPHGQHANLSTLRTLAAQAPSEQQPAPSAAEQARVTAPDWMDEEDHES